MIIRSAHDEARIVHAHASYPPTLAAEGWAWHEVLQRSQVACQSMSLQEDT